MKLLKFAVLCGFASSFSIIAKAQSAYPDYVINNNGDTIKHCKVSWLAFGGQIYNVPGADKSVRIKPDDFKEFCMARDYYTNTFKSVYKEGTNSKIFLLCIEKGKINLFEEVDNAPRYGIAMITVSFPDFYIAKQSDTVKFLKTANMKSEKSRKQREDYFGNLLKDNPDIYKLYNKEVDANDDFSFKTIRSLVHLYNTGRSLDADMKEESAVRRKRLQAQQEAERAKDDWR